MLELERDLVLVIGRLKFITRMRTGVGELDWNGRRDVIRALIRRIEVDHDNVDVVFCVPSRSPEGGGGPSGAAQPVVAMSMAASLAKMPATSVRCLISPLTRSSGLVLWTFGPVFLRERHERQHVGLAGP